MIAESHRGTSWQAGHLRFATDHRRDKALTTLDTCPLHDDTVGHLRIDDCCACADRNVRADAGTAEEGTSGDGNRAKQLGAFDYRPRFDQNRTMDLTVAHVGRGRDAGLEVLEYDSIGNESVFHLSGIDPFGVGEGHINGQSPLEKAVNCVGDFEFAAATGALGSDHIEDGCAEAVDSHNSKIGGRFGGLFDDAEEPVAMEDGNAERRRVRHTANDECSGGLTGTKPSNEVANAAAQHVIAKVENERLTRRKFPRKSESMSDTERSWLAEVGEARTERGAVSSGSHDLLGRIAYHDGDVIDSGINQLPQGEEQHRRVADGEELLGPRVGERAEAAAFPAGKNDRLHDARGYVAIRSQAILPVRSRLVLRVCVNAVSVPPRPAGAGRYAIELICALEASGAVDALVVGPAWLRTYGVPLTVEAPASGATARTAWELTSLPWRVRKLEYDVFHGTHFTVPPGLGRPTVATVHDLTFYLLPRRYDALHRWYYRTIVQTAARADRIIVPSRSVADAFAEHFPLAKRRVRIVPEAPAPSFRPASPEAVAETLSRHHIEGQYLLCVGTGEPNKRAVDAIRALPLLLERGIECQVVLPGNPGRLSLPLAREADRLGVGKRVHFIGYVPDEELRALYTGAVALVFPSLVEGFGLPPLEAMACGTPVIATDAPAMDEVLRGAAIFVPRRDPRAIAEAATRLLTDPAWRAEWSARGQAHAAGYSWQRTAAETVAVYQEALRR